MKPSPWSTPTRSVTARACSPRAVRRRVNSRATGSRGAKLGDLGPYGKQVVQFYTQTKTVTSRWFDDNTVNDGVNTTINLR